MTVINSIRPSSLPTVCDFGWYFGTLGSPQRLAEYTYVINGVTYPPGFTTLGANVTLPTGANIQVASTASFEATGTMAFGLAPGAHTKATYTVVDSTHITCVGGTGSFTTGAAMYDPRFYIDPLPLNQAVIFDATDSNNLDLGKVVAPSGVSIVNYQWDFGDGQISYGPVVTTAYNFNMPLPDLRVTLTVIDSLGRVSSCGHTVILENITRVFGASLLERQGSART